MASGEWRMAWEGSDPMATWRAHAARPGWEEAAVRGRENREEKVGVGWGAVGEPVMNIFFFIFFFGRGNCLFSLGQEEEAEQLRARVVLLEMKSNRGKAKSRNSEMAGNLRFINFVVLLLPAISTPVSSNEDNYFHCERVVKNWVESSCESEQDEDKSSLKDLLFFLHVPRTGGCTYFHCFLRKLYTSAQECPRSYDKLRFDPSGSCCEVSGASKPNFSKANA